MGHGFIQERVTGAKPRLSASYSLGRAQNQLSRLALVCRTNRWTGPIASELLIKVIRFYHGAG
jgi:hypothetical protein